MSGRGEVVQDWYARRHELSPGQIFRTQDGSIVRLDRSVPGDGSAWYVEDWWNGWASMDTKIEPGDLAERMPDGCDVATLAEPQS